MRLPFESQPADEFEAAAGWHERERHGYGALFMDDVRGHFPGLPSHRIDVLV
jgi:hypothetical protein